MIVRQKISMLKEKNLAYELGFNVIELCPALTCYHKRHRFDRIPYCYFDTLAL
jgi:hypothetical protein